MVSAGVVRGGAVRLRYDQAAREGAPFELTAAQVLAAGRMEMSVRDYAALVNVNNVDEHRDLEQANDIRQQALDELEVERIKYELRGAA